jgi:hypothetical protein
MTKLMIFFKYRVRTRGKLKLKMPNKEFMKKDVWSNNSKKIQSECCS